jgi:hypothetical protein
MIRPSNLCTILRSTAWLPRCLVARCNDEAASAAAVLSLGNVVLRLHGLTISNDVPLAAIVGSAESPIARREGVFISWFPNQF